MSELEGSVSESAAPVETSAPESTSGGSTENVSTPKAPEAPPETTAQAIERVAKAANEKAAAEKAKDPAAQKAAPAAPGQVAAPGEASAYKPNTKFKVLDKEHEIDPKFVGLMKDAESEKMIRELHEKAYGLDVVKPKLAEVRGERDQAVQQFSTLNSQISEAREIFQKAVGPGGHILKLDNLWKKLEIPEQVVMNYAIAKAQLAQADPAQRQLFEGRMQAEAQAEAQAKAAASAGQERLALEREMKSQLAEIVLARPDIKPIADAFNERMGQSDAFKKAVFQMGHMAWVSSGGKVNLTPEQAAQEVIKQYGLSAPAAAPAPAATGTEGVVAPAAAGTKTVVVQKTTPTIPNIGSKGNSPLPKTAPRSIEDLKALSAKSQRGEAV